MESVANFHKGINQDLALDEVQNGFCYYLLNGSLVGEDGDTMGSVTSVKGNSKFLDIPDTSEVIKLYNVNLNPGDSYNFDLTLNGLHNITISGTFTTNEVLYSQIKTAIINSQAYQSLTIKSAINSSYMVIWAANGLSITLISSDTTIFDTIELIPAQNNLYMMGWGLIRDDIFIFTINEYNTPNNSTGQIWKIEYNKLTKAVTYTLIYNNFLNLSVENPIHFPGMLEGRYENTGIQKLYWTDTFNPPRVINTKDPDVMALTPSQLNLQSSTHFDIPILQEILQTGGNLEAGLHAVAYRLKNNNGGETKFSLISNPIAITNSNDVTDAFIKIEGSYQGTSTSKQLKYKINSIDTSYERIEIVRILKSNTNSIPIIEIIRDEPIVTDSFQFTYSNHEDKISITLNEFTSLSVIFNTIGTVASKYNFLFLGNIKTSTLDLQYDARAFRYDKNGLTYTHGILPDQLDDINPNQDNKDQNAYLYDVNNNLGGSGLNVSYQFTHKTLTGDTEVINSVGQGFPYRSFGRISGSYNLGTVNQDYPIVNNLNDYHSSYVSSLLKGYTRDEVYRFGLVFYDLQGNPGFVNWIGDIKFPAIYQTDNSGNLILSNPLVNEPSINTFHTNNLGIKFDISIPVSIRDQISGFSIVRCEREDKDKTILGQGLLFPSWFSQSDGKIFLTNTDGPYKNSTPGYPGVYLDSKYMTINSPDFLFSGFSGWKNGDYIEIIGLLEENQQGFINDFNGTPLDGSDANSALSYIAKNYTNVDSSTVPGTIKGNNYKFTLNADTKYIEDYWSNQSDITNTIGGIPSINHSQNNNDDGTGATAFYKNSMGSKTIQLGANWNGFNQNTFPSTHYFFTDGVTDTYRNYHANYIRPNASQYGGNTISQRSLSTYIQCGHYQPINDSSPTSFQPTIFSGDTYVTIFDNIRQFGNWRDTESDQFRIMVGRFHPVETTVNTELRISRSPVVSAGDNECVFNKCTVQGDGFGGRGDTIIDNTEVFIVNHVYDSDNDTYQFFPKPIGFTQDVFQQDTRIYRSQPKINGELSDNWTVFNPDDFIDVDSQYGPLNLLVTWDNNLWFLQDTAFGTTAVKERSVVEDTTGAKLALGTGDVLERFDYLSTVIGTKHKFSVTTGPTGLVWWNVYDKQLYRSRGSKPELISGITGLLNQLKHTMGDNPYKKDGVTGTYDYKLKQFIMSFNINESYSYAGERVDKPGFTVSYSDVLQGIHSFYSYVTPVFINDKYNFITLRQDSYKDLWIHNADNWNTFFDINYPLWLTFIMNDNPDKRKVYDWFEINSTVLDKYLSNGNAYYNPETMNPTNLSVDKVATVGFYRVFNTRQNTNFVTLNNDTVSKQLQNWSTSIQGNRVKDNSRDIFDPNNLHSFPDRKEIPDRIKSLYTFNDFLFTGTEKIIIDSIKTAYRLNS